MNVMKPFGKVSQSDDQNVTTHEKPIEIRCYAPTPVVDNVDDVAIGIAASTDAMFDVQSQVPRCKLCGMEGHFSLRCPKRKEIEVKQTEEQDFPREVTIKISNLADFVTEAQVQDLVNTLKNQANDELQQESRNSGNYYVPVRMLKCSVPKDREGNSRCMAFINIQQTQSINQPKDAPTSADIFAQRLLDLLDRQVLGHTLIEAQLMANDGFRKKKAPNKYDDEEKWGQQREYRK
eukprot:UN01697